MASSLAKRLPLWECDHEYFIEFISCFHMSNWKPNFLGTSAIDRKTDTVIRIISDTVMIKLYINSNFFSIDGFMLLSSKPAQYTSRWAFGTLELHVCLDNLCVCVVFGIIGIITCYCLCIAAFTNGSSSKLNRKSWKKSIMDSSVVPLLLPFGEYDGRSDENRKFASTWSSSLCTSFTNRALQASGWLWIIVPKNKHWVLPETLSDTISSWSQW